MPSACPRVFSRGSGGLLARNRHEELQDVLEDSPNYFEGEETKQESATVLGLGLGTMRRSLVGKTLTSKCSPRCSLLDMHATFVSRATDAAPCLRHSSRVQRQRTLSRVSTGTQHVAADFAPAMRDQLPCCHLVYVQCNTTLFKQPLDISYMRSFKNTLKQVSAQYFANDVVGKTDVVGILASKPELVQVGGGRHCSCSQIWCWWVGLTLQAGGTF